MSASRKVGFALLVCIVLTPFWMWLAWILTPKKKLVAAIIDKTVLTEEGQEHSSITWLLNNNRYSKTSSRLYRPESDYFGFFPFEDEKYQLRGLERYSSDQLDALSKDADLVYFTDTYGIYKNEWYSRKGNTERSGMIYGGLSSQDVEFLRLMKKNRKLILTEFNTIGSPTPAGLRAEFEKLFGLHWTGWTARYFSSFDTTVNAELPRWLINNYKRDHQGKWPFTRGGVAFVSSSDRIVILEKDTHLTDPMPYIERTVLGQKALDLPRQVKYPFWFDVIVPDTGVNKIAARFKIETTEEGLAELHRNGIPIEIPATIVHRGSDYQFYYFSGDFSDNAISMSTCYFKGVSFFGKLFYDLDNEEDRAAFFWEFYEPMMKSILRSYYRSDIQAKINGNEGKG